MYIFKRINIIICLALFILLNINNVSFAAEKKRIAVLNFSVINAPISYGRIVQNYLETELFQINKFHLLEREHITKIYSEKNIKINEPIDESQAITIAKRVKANYAITGTIIKKNDLLITIRLVRVKDNRVILYYNHRISKLDEAKERIKSTAKKISRELEKDVNNNKIPGKKRSKYKIFLQTKFKYLVPVESFSEGVDGGYGFVGSLGIHNIFVKNLFLGIETGYTWFNLQLNKGFCHFVPALVVIGYSYYPIRKLYISPQLCFGMNYIYFSDTKKDSIEPLMKIAFDTGLKINRWLNLEIGLQYGMIFEQEELIHFISFTTGFKFLFSI